MSGSDLGRFSSMEGGLVKALFKSSLIASAVFAAAWFRVPPTAAMIVRNFLYGISITIFSMVLGLPLARLIERLNQLLESELRGALCLWDDGSRTAFSTPTGTPG